MSGLADVCWRMLTYADARWRMVTYGDVEQYVVVTGGIMSGLGKGITASSIGILLSPNSTATLYCCYCYSTLMQGYHCQQHRYTTFTLLYYHFVRLLLLLYYDYSPLILLDMESVDWNRSGIASWIIIVVEWFQLSNSGSRVINSSGRLIPVALKSLESLY